MAKNGYGAVDGSECSSSGQDQEGVISFHSIQYSVRVKKRCAHHDKTIIDNISGVFKPGMNAIMGPTGSGKTSLLDILAARNDITGLTGTILVGGRPQPTDFRLRSGYVVQDDVVMGTLTVRENLMFSANLRLPSHMTSKQRTDRVEEVIAELGLEKCADSKVGTELIRGVSGGERKRTNIGMELITQPSILFLDEPTTGLDSSTANSVMDLLQRMSRKGRTIIFSIHQPRFQIFRLFDELLLLSNGLSVYHGPTHDVMNYFSQIGFECEPHNNPADFFLDIIIQQEGSGKQIKTTDDNDLDVETPLIVSDTTNILSEKYLASLQCQEKEQECSHILNTYLNAYQHGAVTRSPILTYSRAFPVQLWFLSGRAVKNLSRIPQASVGQVLVSAVLAVIVGGIYYQLDHSIKSGIQNRVGAFLFIGMNMIFSNMSAIELFQKERAIFLHETSAGYYRVSSYVFSKIFCDLIPMRAFPAFMFACIAYWMIGLRSDVYLKFWLFFLTLFLTSTSASCVTFFNSSLVSIMGLASLLNAMTFVVMLIFAGLLVNIDSLPEWLQYVKYISIPYYSLTALSINELKDNLFCGVRYNSSDTDAKFTPLSVCESGDVYLESQGIDFSVYGFWKCQIAMASLSVIFVIFTWIKLGTMKKTK